MVKCIFFFYCKNVTCRMLLPAIILIFFSEMTFSQTTIPLYKNVPGSIINKNYHEKADTGSDGIIRISNVSIPEITIFKPAQSNQKNTAVIICPGGGYGILAFNLEGTEVAKIFNSWGITAIVLKYRLPDSSIMQNKLIGPLQDAQRAIQYVRENAGRLGIDPDKIGIMGFSAGGHLAATASTHFEKPVIENPESISLRPDFSILIYPVISFQDSITHLGSRENLAGPQPDKSIKDNFSNELQVNSKTPPAFLALAADDDVVKPENSIRYYEALLRYQVPAEMHIYQNGGHGFGVHNKATKESWMETLKHWMENNHFL
jgi:acetyl esterase/lipase